MAIQREFVLRYRAVGHVRFQIPTRVCLPVTALKLTQGITAISGVTRVRLYASQGKLSIRFNETQCSLAVLAKALAQLLTTLERPDNVVEKTIPKTKLLMQVGNKLKSLKASQWLKAKYGDAKETVQAAKVITQLSMKKPNGLIQHPEKIVVNFLNDLLVLYLIKRHWKQVVSLWLPNPLKYRYEWLTVFYLSYLLVRSRNPSRL